MEVSIIRTDLVLLMFVTRWTEDSEVKNTNANFVAFDLEQDPDPVPKVLIRICSTGDNHIKFPLIK
jgi:hypothetical protein